MVVFSLAFLSEGLCVPGTMGKLGKLLKKAMVISMEDQITYCNKTIQVGPHVLVVTTATVDTAGERQRSYDGRLGYVRGVKKFSRMRTYIND